MEKNKILKIRELLFVAIAFLLGCANILYNVQLYILWVIVAATFIALDYPRFIAQVRHNWKYLILPLGGVLYLVIHYILSLFIGHIGYSASWNRLEILLLYFFFIPVYLVAARGFMTVSLIRRSLLALCWGTLFFNFAKLFYLTGWTLFTDPGNALDMLYNTRFGCHLYFLGGHVYLEPQAIYLSLTAVISFFFILKSFGKAKAKFAIQGMVLFILSLWFLSLTVTKGAILAFLGGFFILAVVAFYKMSLKHKILTGSIIVVLALCTYIFMPDTYTQRIKETQSELQSLRQGELVGGSIAPRLALIQESFNRFDQWGWYGLGVYKNAAAKEWFGQSQYQIAVLGSNVHNCFLEFWMIGGIAGLFFILYYFLVPVWRMIRMKKYSFLVLAMICTLFIGCNTSILIVFVDSVPLIVFFLAMSYFYLDKFIELEERQAC